MGDLPVNDNDQKSTKGIFSKILTACSDTFHRSEPRHSSLSESNTDVPRTTIVKQWERKPAPGPDKMGISNVKQSPQTLRSVIEDDSFWTIDDLKLLQLMHSEYPGELERLKKATFIQNPNASRPKGASISESLYGEDYAEINRTLVGVLALRWLHNNEYGRFVGTQSPASVVLKRESFDWLRGIFGMGLQTADDLYTLVTSMVINDLGKDPNLATDYTARQGIDISHVNHDMILYHAVTLGMVPALDSLNPDSRECLLMGIKLGSDFNFGQLAQAENAPASLAGLLEMRGHARAFEMRFMEQILDLAGASGHEDWTCAKKMIDPVFQSYRNVYDVAHVIISGDMGLREAYDIILTRKLSLLREAGYRQTLDIALPRDRALMRLFCLGNCSSPEDAEVFHSAFDKLTHQTRHDLTRGLNRDGTVENPAVQATYVPAMLSKAVGNTVTGSPDEKTDAVAAVLRYLARCTTVTPPDLAKLPSGVTVIERDVRNVAQILESDEFKTDPRILDEEEIPEGQVANLASGY